MKRIIWDEHDRVQQFVADRTGEDRYASASCLGLEDDGELVAGVVFQNHCGPNVLMHVASDSSRRWMTPAYLYAAFSYPFNALRVRRITGLVRADNQAAQRFDEHLGFVYEGTMREAATDGTDIYVYGLLRRDCRFLTERYRAALLKELPPGAHVREGQ